MTVHFSYIVSKNNPDYSYIHKTLFKRRYLLELHV